MNLNAYLTFGGNCREAFELYARCLGGELQVMTHAQSPMADQAPADWRDKVMHARLAVGDQVLMGSDRPPDSHEVIGGFSVAIGVSDPAEAERIFNTLADKGTVRMPLQETFWARRFGMLVDRFGTPWMVNCEQPPA